MKLIQNAVKINETGQFLVSTHVDDSVSYTWKDGSRLSLTGALLFPNRSGDLFKLNDENRYEEFTLSDEDEFEGWITDRLLGRKLDGEWIPYKDLTKGELEILANSPLGEWQFRVVQYWLSK